MYIGVGAVVFILVVMLIDHLLPAAQVRALESDPTGGLRGTDRRWGFCALPLVIPTSRDPAVSACAAPPARRDGFVFGVARRWRAASMTSMGPSSRGLSPGLLR